MTTGIDIRGQLGCRLWIDGVGCWLVWFGNEFVVGNASSAEQKDLKLQADLRTRHATFLRRGESISLLADGAVRVNDRRIDGETILRNNDEVTLGEDVVWRSLIPSPLSRSAVLRFESSHRPVPRIDGAVLFDQTCLLGPGQQTHIPCPEWKESVVLFARDGGLWMRTGDRNDQPRPVADGDVIGGDDWRFRIEAIV